MRVETVELLQNELGHEYTVGSEFPSAFLELRRMDVLDFSLQIGRRVDHEVEDEGVNLHLHAFDRVLNFLIDHSVCLLCPLDGVDAGLTRISDELKVVLLHELQAGRVKEREVDRDANVFD